MQHFYFMVKSQTKHFQNLSINSNWFLKAKFLEDIFVSFAYLLLLTIINCITFKIFLYFFLQSNISIFIILYFKYSSACNLHVIRFLLCVYQNFRAFYQFHVGHVFNFSWKPSPTTDPNSFIQVEFPSLYHVKYIVTEGIQNEYILTFDVHYTTDMITWVSKRNDGTTMVCK